MKIILKKKIILFHLNQTKQLDNFLLINSISSIKNTKFSLKDLQSRINSFIYIGIELPTDDLVRE